MWDDHPVEAGHLSLNWTYDGVPTSLTVNWKLESDTAFVVVAVDYVDGTHDREAQVHEVPTSMNALLVVGEKEAANLTVRVPNYDSLCGYLTYEPTNLNVQGAFGQYISRCARDGLHCEERDRPRHRRLIFCSLLRQVVTRPASTGPRTSPG